MVPVAYNVRNLMVRKATTAAAAGGLALVVFVFASVLMLSHGIERTLGRTAAEDVAIVIRKGSDNELSSGIEDQSVGVILNAPEVARSQDNRPLGVGEVVVVILLEKFGTDGLSNIQVRGIPDRALEFRKEVKLVAGRAPQPGTNEVIVGKAIRGRFKSVDIGQTFELKKNRPAQVVGVFEDGGSSLESEILGDLNVMRQAFGREGIVSSVRVRLSSPAKYDAFETYVESNRQLGLEVYREGAYFEKQSSQMSMFIKILGMVIAVFFSFGAMIGAMITMHASVANRQREIGTLRALGFSKGSILFSFLIESILLSILGGAVGAALSMLMTFVSFSTVNWATFSEIVFAFEPSAEIIVRALIAATIMGLIGGFLPAIRAARMSPVLAMRN